MKKTLFACCLMMALAGCTSFPTETASAVDNRPTISFQCPHTEAAVYVDGHHVGSVSDFKAGSAGLRVLPGTHVIQIHLPNQRIFAQKIYVGNGVHKVLSTR